MKCDFKDLDFLIMNGLGLMIFREELIILDFFRMNDESEKYDIVVEKFKFGYF